jgi:hypothetical protein
MFYILVPMMKTKLATVSVIAAVTLMIATTIASMAPSAMALRQTIVGGQSNAANNVGQAGLVNANVGANALNNAAVCVNVLASC